MTLYYYFSFVASILVLIWMSVRKHRLNLHYIYMAVIVSISDFGAIAMINATSVAEAILANRLIYLGGVALPYLIFLLAADLCAVRCPKWVKAILFLETSTVYGFACSAGYTNFFYKAVFLQKWHGIPYLIKDYGWAHNLHLAHISAYSVGIIACIVRAYFKKKNVSYKAARTIAIIMITNALCYVLEKLLGVRFDLMPICYLVSEILMLQIAIRANLYDTAQTVAMAVNNLTNKGYISFDKNKNFVGADEFTRNIFPEIENWTIDYPVPESDSVLYTEVIKWLSIDNIDVEKRIGFDNGNRFVKVIIRKITTGSREKMIGYLVVFTDETARQQYVQSIEEVNDNLYEALAEKNKALTKEKEKYEKLSLSAVMALSNAVEYKDKYTNGHSKRVAEYAKIISKRMGMDEEFLNNIYLSGLLHDVGKIGVSDAIINKDGKLTDEEYEAIKQHPIMGWDILKNVIDEDIILVGAKSHHERYDGKGYPEGLKGEEIPFAARIIGVADAYDTMSSNRSYREALAQSKIRDEIVKGRGTQFDPVVADIMIQMIDEDKKYEMRQHV